MNEDPKKKALMGIKGFLDGKMGERMKPPPMPMEKGMETPSENMMESPSQEGGLEGALEAAGGDSSKLSPEEQQQLQMLLSKMEN